jgi:hypothetical protein
MDNKNWDPNWDRSPKSGSLKSGSDRTIASGECEPTTHNRLAHHQ